MNKKNSRDYVKSTTSVWQYYNGGDQIKNLFEDARFVTNEAIRLGNKQNLTAKRSFHDNLYNIIDGGNLPSKIKQSQIYKAHSLLKAMRTNIRKGEKTSIPYVWKSAMYITNQSYKIKKNHVILRLSSKKNIKIKIKLNKYIIKKLQDAKTGTIILTPEKIVISITRYVKKREKAGYIAMDINHENVTTFDDAGVLTVIDTSQILKASQISRDRQKGFQRDDVRIRKKIAGQCGKKSHDRTQDVIHKTMKAITKTGKIPIREDLEGLVKQNRKNKNKGKNANFKAHSWNYYEFGRQIDYKAKMNGTDVIKINPAGTSTRCVVCGERLISEERRQMRCPNGYASMDRDKHAAIHIYCRGIKRPKAGLDGDAHEAMKMLRHGSKSLVEVVLADAFQKSTSKDVGVK